MAEETKLFRVENPEITNRNPESSVSHPALVGQWFSPELNAATQYLRKATQTFGHKSEVVDGAQLVIAKVPELVLPELHVARHPIARSMDVEGDNYLVPRDGTFPLTVVGLDPLIGDLRGKLGNLNNLNEAKRRIVNYLGELGVLDLPKA